MARSISSSRRKQLGSRLGSEPGNVDSRFESAFANAPIAMALVDRNGLCVEVNEAFCRITGYSRDELESVTLRSVTHPDDADLDARSKLELLRGRIPSYQVEKRLRHAHGHHLWVLFTTSMVRDDEGHPLYVISQLQDISGLRERAEHLEYLVDHDFLTGLYNRRRFERELVKEVQRSSRYGPSGALLLIDLDHFKEVNDTLGHESGDALLKEMARALKARMRRTDVLARWGGDEFAVLLPQTSAEQARSVAYGIVDALRQHVTVAFGRPISVTGSVGVALAKDLDAAELMARADCAMYEAKARGRDRFAMYRLAPAARSAGSLRLAVKEARKIAEEDRFP